jgi:hypothetical protein
MTGRRNNSAKTTVLALLLLTIVLGLLGCSSEPQGTPVGQRAPGKDITKEDRADKRGDIPDLKAK